MDIVSKLIISNVSGEAHKAMMLVTQKHSKIKSLLNKTHNKDTINIGEISILWLQK